MKHFIAVLIRLIPVTVFFLCLQYCHAAEQSWSPITLDELGITYRNYKLVNPNNRPLLIYPESAKEGINVGMNMDVLTYGYMDTTIESLTTDSQYRSIGLQLDIGVRLTDYLSVGYWHHSQHVLERADSYVSPFPVEDAVEVKFTIYHARPGRPAMF